MSVKPKHEFLEAYTPSCYPDTTHFLDCKSESTSRRWQSTIQLRSKAGDARPVE